MVLKKMVLLWYVTDSRVHFQRPLVIQPNLPRLIEAVVKSLDPNSSGDREATIDAATEILVYVVQMSVSW
jgi:hypothetical protein